MSTSTRSEPPARARNVGGSVVVWVVDVVTDSVCATLRWIVRVWGVGDGDRLGDVARRERSPSAGDGRPCTRLRMPGREVLDVAPHGRRGARSAHQHLQPGQGEVDGAAFHDRGVRDRGAPAEAGARPRRIVLLKPGPEHAAGAERSLAGGAWGVCISCGVWFCISGWAGWSGCV